VRRDEVKSEGLDTNTNRARPELERYDVVIAIPNNNHSALLERCLASIVATVRKSSYLIAVLDNFSSDDSVEMMKSRFPMVAIIEQKEKHGFVRNMNRLIAEFGDRGRYFLMLNDDTELLPGALDELVRFMDRHPEIGAVGPRMVYPDGRPQASGWPLPTPQKELWRYSGLGLLVDYRLRRWIGRRFGRFLGPGLESYFRGFWETTRPRTIGYASGGCLLIRDTTLQQVGPLSLDFRMYGEDFDWCRRARAAGWKIAINPRATIIHLGMQSYSRYSLVEFERASLRYFRKYGVSRLALAVYRGGIIALSLVKILGSALGLGSELQRRVPRHERIAGYWDVIGIMVRGE
jgi:GT2 family glycosyltransferase